MKHKILVAVTGKTPQIITEMLYALHQQNQWIPEKVIVFTTIAGKREIVNQLLGEDGYFNRLCQDYRLPPIVLNEETIKVISENNVELDDIRTVAQNNASADLIVREIYDLCQTPDTELHISIAGGRKSMGFYIGYALSLFGRPQDTMSHVLVDEDFEQHPKFFYPPPSSCMLPTRNGEKDASLAQITLAEIPFVRMTENKLQFAFDNHLTFSQAVQHIQNILNHGTRIQFDVLNRTVIIGHIAKLILDAVDFCIYATMAKRKQEGKITEFSEEGTHAFAMDYVEFYQYHWEGLCKSGVDKADRLNKVHELCQASRDVKRADIETIFSVSNSRIKKALKKQLGDYGSHFAIVSSGKNNAKTYDLAIEAQRIEIII